MTFHNLGLAGNGFQTVSQSIGLVALFGYLNHRFIKLPDAVGITAIGVVMSLAAMLLSRIDSGVAKDVQRTVGQFDFSVVVLHGLLGSLLFAGSLQMNVQDVAKGNWLILSLSTMGILLSTGLVAAGYFATTRFVGRNIPTAGRNKGPSPLMRVSRSTPRPGRSTSSRSLMTLHSGSRDLMSWLRPKNGQRRRCGLRKPARGCFSTTFTDLALEASRKT